jgi:hypothetical protein
MSELPQMDSALQKSPRSSRYWPQQPTQSMQHHSHKEGVMQLHDRMLARVCEYVSNQKIQARTTERNPHLILRKGAAFMLEVAVQIPFWAVV